MTTLEKLCRAACEADGSNPEWLGPTFKTPQWNGYEAVVLAVLSALEDPSDEMVEAGLAAPDSGWTDVELRGRFTAMIRNGIIYLTPR